MPKPRVIFAHCWEGNPTSHAFYPDSRRKLEAAGLPVDIPAMPDTYHPKREPWISRLQETLAPRFTGEKRIVVAHSLGGITTMRCIERGIRIDGFVAVAVNVTDVGFGDELGEFFEDDIDYATVREGVSRRPELFYSDDDPYVPMEEGLALNRALDGNMTVMQGMRHFSGPIGEPGTCEKLPEVVQAVCRLAQIV